MRISPFDSAARRQTSFASVDVLPEIDDTIDIVLSDDELKRDVFRSGGPGGQHQNKTESGVRYTHLPDGRRRRVAERTLAAQERRQRPGHCSRPSSSGWRKRNARPSSPRNTTRRARSASAARSAPTCSSPTRSSRTCGPTRGRQPRAVLDGDLDGFIEAYLRMKLAKGVNRPCQDLTDHGRFPNSSWSKPTDGSRSAAAEGGSISCGWAISGPMT